MAPSAPDVRLICSALKSSPHTTLLSSAGDRPHHRHPCVQHGQDRVRLFRWQAGGDAVDAGVAVALRQICVGRLATERDIHLVGVTVGLGAHLPELRNELDQRRRASFRHLRHPAIAIADGAPRRVGKCPAHKDRGVRLLYRLGPGHHRIKVHELSVIFGLRPGPDFLHCLDVLSRALVASGEGGPVVLHLVLVPAISHPKTKRPPETWSIEATSLAVWIGSRWATRQTPVPTFNVLVAIAAAVSVTNGSMTS